METNNESVDILHSLRIHEMYYDSTLNIYIVAVPGGWIYDCYDSEYDTFKQGIFIPKLS